MSQKKLQSVMNDAIWPVTVRSGEDGTNYIVPIRDVDVVHRIQIDSISRRVTDAAVSGKLIVLGARPFTLGPFLPSLLLAARGADVHTPIQRFLESDLDFWPISSHLKHATYKAFFISRNLAITSRGSVLPVARRISSVSTRMKTLCCFSSPMVNLPCVCRWFSANSCSF